MAHPEDGSQIKVDVEHAKKDSGWGTTNRNPDRLMECLVQRVARPYLLEHETYIRRQLKFSRYCWYFPSFEDYFNRRQKDSDAYSSEDDTLSTSAHFSLQQSDNNGDLTGIGRQYTTDDHNCPGFLNLRSTKITAMAAPSNVLEMQDISDLKPISVWSCEHNNWLPAIAEENRSSDTWVSTRVLDRLPLLHMEPLNDASTEFIDGLNLTSQGIVFLHIHPWQCISTVKVRAHVTDHPEVADLLLGVDSMKKVEQKRRSMESPIGTRQAWFRTNRMNQPVNDATPPPSEPTSHPTNLSDMPNPTILLSRMDDVSVDRVHTLSDSGKTIISGAERSSDQSSTVQLPALPVQKPASVPIVPPSMTLQLPAVRSPTSRSHLETSIPVGEHLLPGHGFGDKLNTQAEKLTPDNVSVFSESMPARTKGDRSRLRIIFIVALFYLLIGGPLCLMYGFFHPLQGSDFRKVFLSVQERELLKTVLVKLFFWIFPASLFCTMALLVGWLCSRAGWCFRWKLDKVLSHPPVPR